MNAARHHIWHHQETGEPAGESTDQMDWLSNPICPLCGQPTEYDEFVYDQDRQGNDIRGWNWQCNHCHIGTELVEI